MLSGHEAMFPGLKGTNSWLIRYFMFMPVVNFNMMTNEPVF